MKAFRFRDQALAFALDRVELHVLFAVHDCAEWYICTYTEWHEHKHPAIFDRQRETVRYVLPHGEVTTLS